MTVDVVVVGVADVVVVGVVVGVDVTVVAVEELLFTMLIKPKSFGFAFTVQLKNEKDRFSVNKKTMRIFIVSPLKTLISILISSTYY